MSLECGMPLDNFLSRVSDYQEFCDPSARSVLDRAVKTALFANNGRLSIGTLVMGMQNTYTLREYGGSAFGYISKEDIAQAYNIGNDCNQDARIYPSFLGSTMDILLAAQREAANNNQVLITSKNIFNAVYCDALRNQDETHTVDPFIAVRYKGMRNRYSTR